ncbi:hypothetical protein QL285_099227 [Trifolium repens]|nr:hypothetical protein QL285_099227 [Trifolium repens]
MASGATCVQRLDGSRDSAIHTKYRISLRSSSMQEPRYPLPRVILYYVSEHNPHETVSGAMQVRSEQILNSLTHSAPGFVFWHKGERTTSSSSEPEASRGVEHLKPTLCVQTDSRVGLHVRHRQ